MATDSSPPPINGGTLYGKAYMPHNGTSTDPTTYTPLDVDKYLCRNGGPRREPVSVPSAAPPPRQRDLPMLDLPCHLADYLLLWALQSALRALIPFMEIPGMISLGGGMPNPQLFPLQESAYTTLPLPPVNTTAGGC